MSSRERTSSLPEFPLVARVRVRTYELDSFGHVNNAVYLQYLEEARSEYLRQMGLSFRDFSVHGVQIVIAEATIRYLSPLRYGDSARIEGRITALRPVSANFEYRLIREDGEERIAEASTRGVFVRAESGRPTRAPQPFREAFARFTGERSLTLDAE
ncbi:MAG: thioesterase family protein [Capsulimonadales bacterium]|nr:thioesterase family protein [Capsulimonadales bacterium]